MPELIPAAPGSLELYTSWPCCEHCQHSFRGNQRHTRPCPCQETAEDDDA